MGSSQELIPGSSGTVLGDRELTEVQTGVLVRTDAIIKHPGWELEGQKLLSRGSGGSLLAMCSCGKESNESLPLLIRLPVLQGWGLVTSFSLNYLLKGPTSKHRASTWESGGHHSVHGSTHFIHFLQRLVIYTRYQTLLVGEMMGVSMRPLPQTSLMSGDAASMPRTRQEGGCKRGSPEVPATFRTRGGQGGLLRGGGWETRERLPHRSRQSPRSRAPSLLRR